jgi:hypothetical protein
MGIDSLIQNGNPNWNNNVVFIKINKEICRSMKQVNKALVKELEEKKKKVKSSKEIEEEKKKKMDAYKKKEYYKNKFESNKY